MRRWLVVVELTLVNQKQGALRMLQIIPENHRGGVRGFNSEAERQEGIAELRAKGFNYFTCYKDTQAEYAVSYGRTVVMAAMPVDSRPWQPTPGHPGYDLLH